MIGFGVVVVVEGVGVVVGGYCDVMSIVRDDGREVVFCRSRVNGFEALVVDGCCVIVVVNGVGCCCLCCSCCCECFECKLVAITEVARDGNDEEDDDDDEVDRGLCVDGDGHR